MKKLLLLGMGLCAFGAFAQNVNIPDANFKAYLVGNSQINTNGDTEIQVSEASSFQFAIDCPNNNISDLTGIEAFTSLSALFCHSNQLTSLNISANTALQQLHCGYNQLTNLDVSNNPQLWNLRLEGNQISSINLANNTGLTQLRCEQNQLTTLDVSACTLLEELRCESNSLTSLDLSSNTVLDELYCAGNDLTSLDMSNNVLLSRIWCQSNQLVDLNMANGNNTALSSYNVQANSNPGLSCIQVDDAAWSTSNWTNIDATASFSENCSGGSSCATTVNIPDANFKAYLVGNTTINTDGDNEICITEAQAYSGTINCQGLNISDLTGIESFPGITGLNFQNNQVSSIDISSNQSLTSLSAANNQLTSIDLTNNVLLASVSLGGNQLTSLDVSQNPNIWNLSVVANQLTALDVSSVPALVELNCHGNQLTTLDMSANALLADFACSSNNLIALNVANGNNTSFTHFQASTNPSLTCIQVDDAAWSTTNWANIDATASFSENCNLGISESNELSFVVYPNPTNGFISVDASVTVDEVEVLDITGKRVAHSVSNEVDLSSLEAGTYFAKIHHNNTISLRQIIKE